MHLSVLHMFCILFLPGAATYSLLFNSSHVRSLLCAFSGVVSIPPSLPAQSYVTPP